MAIYTASRHIQVHAVASGVFITARTTNGGTTTILSGSADDLTLDQQLDEYEAAIRATRQYLETERAKQADADADANPPRWYDDMFSRRATG